MNDEAIQINTLIELYKQEYGVSLSEEDASAELQRLKNIYRIVYKVQHETNSMV